LLPRATPELNAMDHLWKHTKGTVLGDRPTESIDPPTSWSRCAKGDCL
jgi:hypothetical protein